MRFLPNAQRRFANAAVILREGRIAWQQKRNRQRHRKRAARPKAAAKSKKVMHEFKEGELKSGGRKKVTNPKQAIAIALSEARQSGAKIPKKGAAAKKPQEGAAEKGRR